MSSSSSSRYEPSLSTRLIGSELLCLCSVRFMCCSYHSTGHFPLSIITITLHTFHYPLGLHVNLIIALHTFHNPLGLHVNLIIALHALHYPLGLHVNLIIALHTLHYPLGLHVTLIIALHTIPRPSPVALVLDFGTVVACKNNSFYCCKLMTMIITWDSLNMVPMVWPTTGRWST